jgi:hypothetical protein
MLPEPTIPKPSAEAPAPPQPQAMTPLFAVPGSESHTPPGHQRRPGRRVRRPNSRLPADRASREGLTADTRQGNDPADLLAVTSQRLRRALGRSFLRYGIPGDLEGAIHAAMNVVEPVLQARDTEILRLRRLMTARIPGR